MKQAFRFLLQPAVFFNQLQWSRNHWLILALFLLVAAIETQLGQYHNIYRLYIELLTGAYGVTPDTAVWIITAGKLLAMVTGAYLISTVVWVIGNLVGHEKSKRVLFRRLSIVFTVALIGFTAQHLVPQYPALFFVSSGLYIWAALLGFFAIKEQFDLNLAESFMIAVLASLMIAGGWTMSGTVATKVAKAQLQESGLAGKKVPGKRRY